MALKDGEISMVHIKAPEGEPTLDAQGLDTRHRLVGNSRRYDVRFQDKDFVMYDTHNREVVFTLRSKDAPALKAAHVLEIDDGKDKLGAVVRSKDGTVLWSTPKTLQPNAHMKDHEGNKVTTTLMDVAVAFVNNTGELIIGNKGQEVLCMIQTPENASAPSCEVIQPPA